MQGGIRRSARPWPALIAISASVAAIALLTRGYLPVDETRYVGVAWEMWLRGDFLVPYRNGVPYSDKPPLLFWLFHGGWWLFGVNEWWPRLVPPLFALINLALTARLARLLWPALPSVHAQAPVLLVGLIFWGFYANMLLFDMLMTGGVLLAFIGMATVWRGHAWRGWTLFSAAVALGALSKGPVIALYILPAALLVPWWSHRSLTWMHWYVGLTGAMFVGVLIALAWTLPAAAAGGSDYAAALWQQSTKRMAGDAIPHQRPWWWYAALLPMLLLPWTLWPPLKRGLAVLVRAAGDEPGLRLCIAWAVPALLSLSLIGGKQVHYLLPVLPAFSLLGARALAQPSATIQERDRIAPALLVIAIGIILTLALLFARHYDDAWWLSELTPVWGVAAILIGILLLVPGRRSTLSIAAVSAGLVIITYLGVVRVMGMAYDLRPASRYLAQAERSGHAIAHIGPYHNQFQFLGRLRRPLQVFPEPRAATVINAWLHNHPTAKVVVYYRQWTPIAARRAGFAQAYRGGGLAIWDSATLLAHPEWLHDWPP